MTAKIIRFPTKRPVEAEKPKPKWVQNAERWAREADAAEARARKKPLKTV